MKNFKQMLVFLILICFSNCAEFQYSARRQSQAYSIQNCKEIYGKWEVYGFSQVDRRGKRDEIKPTIWIFSKDGTLVVNGETKSFKIEDDCSKLIIGNDSNFYSMWLTTDTLFFSKKSNYSVGAYTISLKKIN